jgi:hypothetical protein
MNMVGEISKPGQNQGRCVQSEHSRSAMHNIDEVQQRSVVIRGNKRFYSGSYVTTLPQTRHVLQRFQALREDFPQPEVVSRHILNLAIEHSPVVRSKHGGHGIAKH